MKLLPETLIRKFPHWGSFKYKNFADIKVVCKFYLPGTCREWYLIEYDRIDEFFGVIKDEEGIRLAYFTLEQLLQKKGPMRTRVIRDKWFSSCKLINLMERRYERIR